jgi:hypothetical protein
MRRLTLVGVLVVAIMAVGLPANATIHETVGSACNGEGFLDPAPLGFATFGTAGNSTNSPDALAPFGTTARPVIANGVVDTTTFLTTDSPASKFPVGSDATALTLNDLDHPSSDHCFNLQP